ncbi:hypothetical protein ADL22_00830 [Streptomyces sp. NRRL F-4489]|uniref:hypothetical protein n=1 Tax=Streptomyces sp. NRRL F-4489 TaxID=1609095 RepID=UPI00074A2323|nr:hypothetical protein [Streptomyces sp. NRRL F-4489]KUL55470.1 hypothetical protein ADL22_00830 [Streptomyces sp. NRRL F-4489]
MPFLGDLGRQLAQRWTGRLGLPGVLLAATALAGSALGQRHAFDHARLAHRAAAGAAAFAARPPAVQLLLAGGLLLAVAAAGAAVESAAGVVLRLWLGPWPRALRGPAAALTARREGRWAAAQRRVADLQAALPAPRAPAEARELDEAAAAREAIAPARPSRPTWMGDRVAGADARVLHQYGLDLAAVWPRLWLVLPQEVRDEVTAARRRVEAAARLATWAVPFAALAVVWWPALPLAAVPALAGWRRGRSAVATYAVLLEAAVDVHAADLAARAEEGGEWTVERGEALTRRLRKGS